MEKHVLTLEHDSDMLSCNTMLCDLGLKIIEGHFGSSKVIQLLSKTAPKQILSHENEMDIFYY